MKKLLKNQFSYSIVIFSLLSFIMYGGCASIISGGPQVVPINSNPSDAQLKIVNLRTNSTMYAGKTPYTVTLERGAGYFKKAMYNVVVEKEGFKTTEILIEGSPGGWYILGNFVFGGLIGWLIVDPLTGAMWTLTPSDVSANLETKTALFDKKEGLMIVLKSDLPELPESILNKMKPVEIK